MRALRYATAALMAGLSSQAATAACYVVYGPDQEVIYRSMEPPVDLSRPLHETLPRVAPGGAPHFFARFPGLRTGNQQVAPAAQPGAAQRPAQGTRNPG